MGFIFSGAVATAVNLAIFMMLLEQTAYLIAGGLGYLSGTAVSFLLNKSFVFSRRGPSKFLAFKYVAVDVISLTCQLFLLYGLVQMGFHEIFANLVAIATVTVGKFFIMRHLVF